MTPLSPLASHALLWGLLLLVLGAGVLADRAQTRARQRLQDRLNDGTRPQPASSERVRHDREDREDIMPSIIDRREHCSCTGDRSIYCPAHGNVGLRIGIDIHAAACFDKGTVDRFSCTCGLLDCSWVSCLDDAKVTIEFEGGLYRLCGDHWILHDLGLLLTGEVAS